MFAPSPYTFENRGLASAFSQETATVGGVLTSIAPATGPAAPFVAAAGQIANLVAQIGQFFQGCGQTCIQTSQWADEAENALNQIVQTYWNTPTPRYASFQASTVAAIQHVFQQLQQLCSNPQMGAAGQRCISERLVQNGTAPWCPNPGHTGCDWVTAYLVPIAHDTEVIPDPPGMTTTPTGQLVSAAGASGSSSLLSGSMVPVLAIAALAVVALVAFS